MGTLTQASHQWATRPRDERFLDLNELQNRVGHVKENSLAKVVSSRKLRFQPSEADPRRGLEVIHEDDGIATPTHFSFGQLASLAKAPAGYLRTLPAPIAADNLNYGMRFAREAENVGVLLTSSEFAGEGGLPALKSDELRAATGPNYGRIWNADIVAALREKFGDGRTGDFRVPGEFGKQVEITRDNTTIYGSDRDMFVFLADETNRIEVPNRRDGKPGSLAKGFFVWNSEVGSSTMGAAFFLFDYACSNRTVWGAQGFQEIRLRHTANAPDRWLEEIAPVLLAYSKASAGPVEETIKAAQAKKMDDDLDDFLKARFTAPQAASIKQAHVREEGRPIETLWDVTTAITAHAKSIVWQDERVALERQAGKVLDLVAA
jgi:hypothetical protein